MRASVVTAALLACALVGGVADAKPKKKKAPVTTTAPSGETIIELPHEAPVTAPEAPSVVVAEHDKVLAPSSAPPKRVTISLNPLPMAAGRFGANVEYVVARHHVAIASGYYQTFPTGLLKLVMPSVVDTSAGAQGRLGGELGYRYYTGSQGANGLFAGASVVAMPFVLPRLKSDFTTDVVSFETFGAALDVGAQYITDWGLTIGGGLGAMYLAYEPPTSATPPPGAPNVHIFEPHVLPRLLLAAGWSF